MAEMITVNQAREAIQRNVTALSSKDKAIGECLGLTLATDIHAPINLPPFDQSSMDGYAIRFEDRAKPLEIKGESAAGSSTGLTLEAGQAIRIFTGAPLPKNADTVVIQEKVEVKNGQVLISDDRLLVRDNVRKLGAEMEKGAMVLEKGTMISPAIIGFLSGFGITKLSVYPHPEVAIIATGNELQTPGIELESGQIYESNTPMLQAALKQLNITSVSTSQVKDDLESLISELRKVLDQADLILLTGGVSVGDHDHVVEATRQCGISQVFHKVKQKPGKPLFFGRRDNKIVFGLPGNPSSVLTCFYQYVLPATGILVNQNLGLQTRFARLSHDLTKPEGLTQFVKAEMKNGVVKILGAQASYRLSSFAQANCLVELPEKNSSFQMGEEVFLHLLP